MEVSMLQLPPGDPGLIDKIVCQLKSNGIFDQFRKECIADVDTKPAYQNLRQRVEGSVSSFLTNQAWRADLNKNQLRDNLRKHIHESGFLDIGVERIVDQVVNPKIYTVFFPKVEDVVYGFLGVEKPKKGADVSNSIQTCVPKSEEAPKFEKKFVSLKDLLPTDLDPISPEKFDSDEDMDENSADKTKDSDFQESEQPSNHIVRVKEEVTSDVEHDFDGEDEEEEDEDEASPPFESLDADAMDAGVTPPIIPLQSADMLDNITSSSSSSETKDLLQFGETRKRIPDKKTDTPIKKEFDVEEQKVLLTEEVKPETPMEYQAIKQEDQEECKDWLELKEVKKEKKEERNKDSLEKKDEGNKSRKHESSKEGRDKHSQQEKKSRHEGRHDKDEVKRAEREEHRKSLKEEHKKGEKDEGKKGDREEAKKGDREKDEVRKGERSEKKHVEKEDGRKIERESSKRHEKDNKEDKKSTKEREEKRSDKDKKHTREKDDNRKGDKEKEEGSRRNEKERSETKKKDKKEKVEKERDDKKGDKERDEKKEKEDKKVEKEREEKKVEKEREDKKPKEDLKKTTDRDDLKKSDKEEVRKSDKDKEKHRSSNKLVKGEKDVKEQSKCEHSKDKSAHHHHHHHGSSKTSSVDAALKKDGTNEKSSSDKKKEGSVKKCHNREPSKTGLIGKKEKKVGEKDKKMSSTDDHRHERDKGKNGHRRSDRDKDRERERSSQVDGSNHTNLVKDASGQQSTSTTSTPSSSSSNESKGDGSSGGGGGGGGNSEDDINFKANPEKQEKNERFDGRFSDVCPPVNNNSTANLMFKIKKPKIAANIYEVKKIIQVRKNLKKLERERMISSNANSVIAERNDQPEVVSCTTKCADDTKSDFKPPQIKRAKLGTVEQDLRGEMESSVLVKGLLEDEEDGELGEVHFLEHSASLPDFVLYVQSLTKEAASGDYSRVPPSPTNSIATNELSDYEDNVILSDIELSKEDEDVVKNLGGHVERKYCKVKSPKKSIPAPLPQNLPEIPTDVPVEGSNKRSRRPNPRYNSGEYEVYSDEEIDEDEIEDNLMRKKSSLVDGIEYDIWKTPKERSLDIDEEIGVGHSDTTTSLALLPTPENDVASEEREIPVLSKRNQVSVDEKRKIGKRLGVRGPLRRVPGNSPGTPDPFVMPLSPESDVSSASGDTGKRVSTNPRAIENQYHHHQGDIDGGDLGAEDFDHPKVSDYGDTKESLGAPISSLQQVCVGAKNRTSDHHHHHHDDSGHPSSEYGDGERRLDDLTGLGPRRLRGTRSSIRVQQRYSSDDLYKPRPNITLGRRNRGRNSPSQDEVAVTDHNCLKQGQRVSSQGTDELLDEECIPNKRRRR